MVDKLCLGHATIGAYSCFEKSTEGIDTDGDGYCEVHAAFIHRAGGYMCTKCAHLVWDEGSGKGHWAFNPQCIRCGGSGKETLL